MAYSVSLKTASTSAITTLATAGAAYTDVMVRVNTGTIYLGGAAVTTAAGMSVTTAWSESKAISLPKLEPGESLYCCGSSSGISVEVLTHYSTQAG